MKPTSVICTVGTSLKNSFKDEINNKPLNKKIQKSILSKLTKLSLDDRRCGAEINSINSMLQKGYIKDPSAIYFLVSDTKDGQFFGDLVRIFLSSKFKNAECLKVEGLIDTDFKKFKNHGLKSLVRSISNLVRKEKTLGRDVVINSTGGFKAQISFAGLIGQVLHVPVYYQFEAFNEVIELPPMPVFFDYHLWLKYFGLFDELEKELQIEEDKSYMPLDQRIYPLLDIEEIDGKEYWAISPMGQLFYEGFIEDFAITVKNFLPPEIPLNEKWKKPNFEDENEGRHKGLKEYLYAILELPYVKGIYTHYFNPALSRANRFRKSSKGKINQIEGWYTFREALTKFDIITTATTEEQRQAVLFDLTRRFIKKRKGENLL